MTLPLSAPMLDLLVLSVIAEEDAGSLKERRLR